MTGAPTQLRSLYVPTATRTNYRQDSSVHEPPGQTLGGICRAKFLHQPPPLPSPVIAGRRDFRESTTLRRHFFCGPDRICAKVRGVQNLSAATPAINARFLRKDAFARFGPFRSDIPIAADRYLLLRLCLEGVRIVVLDRPLYGYCEHAGSATLDPEGRQGAQILRDHIALAHELLGPRPLPGLPRSTVHAWLALESVHLELIRGSAATIGRALPALARLFAADRLWPIHFLDAARRRRRLRRLSMTGG